MRAGGAWPASEPRGPAGEREPPSSREPERERDTELEAVSRAGWDTPCLGVSGERWARVLDVCDGDTVTAAMMVGGAVFKVRVRLAGIDADELRASGGHRARARLFELLTGEAIGEGESMRAALCGGRCTVRAVCHGADKYGRVLADMLLPTGGTASDVLLSEGLARPYVKEKGKAPPRIDRSTEARSSIRPKVLL